jgi:hypothetical protein
MSLGRSFPSSEKFLNINVWFIVLINFQMKAHNAVKLINFKRKIKELPQETIKKGYCR